MISFDQRLGDLAVALFDVGAIQFGAFRFKHHEYYLDMPLAPNKINLRTPDNGGNLMPELVAAIGQQLYVRIQDNGVEFDLIAGLPKAGEPFAEIIAKLSGKPILKFGKEIQEGRRRIASIISGNYSLGQRVLLIDDVISWGNSKKEAVAVCRDAGLIIFAVAVFVDREEGGSLALESVGCKVIAVFQFSQLLEFYFRVGKIKRENLDAGQAYSWLMRQKALGRII